MHDSVIRLLTVGMEGSEPDDAERLSDIEALLTAADQIAALNDEELGALDVELREVADRILDGTAVGIDRNDTEALTEIADALGVIRTEAGERVETAAARQAEVDEIMARIRLEEVVEEEVVDERLPGETDQPTGDPDAEPDKDDDEETPDEEPAQAVEVLEPVTASGVTLPTLNELATRVQRRQSSRPASMSMLARTEHPFIKALERGGKAVDLNEFSRLAVERWTDFAGTAPGEGELKFRLGRIDILGSFPEDRILRASDSQFVNDAKIEAVTASAMRREPWTDEIVASGGFCAPTPASYDIEQLSGTQRPIRDSLPRFGADRGGIRFTPPPDMADILSDQVGGAVGLWTNATDLSPGGAVKSCQTITCQAVTEVLTQAIYSCLGFGNFGARAYPEWVRAWTLNAASRWARVAERELLDGIDASTTKVTDTGIYGFVPELLTHILQLAVGERNRQRMDPNTRMRVLLPNWVIAQMQIDYLRQGSVETVFKDEGSLRAMFSAAGVNVTLYEDERTGAGQIVGSQGQGVGIRDLPDVVEWYLYHEGAFVFLDGGSLDLGVVRDSTLNATNDFRIFTESWEGVAFKGVFAYRVRDTLCPSGDRQSTVDLDPCGAS